MLDCTGRVFKGCTETQASLVNELLDSCGFMSFMNLCDAGVYLSGGGEASLEVGVNRGCGKLGSKRACVLELGAVAAGVVN